MIYHIFIFSMFFVEDKSEKTSGVPTDQLPTFSLDLDNATPFVPLNSEVPELVEADERSEDIIFAAREFRVSADHILRNAYAGLESQIAEQRKAKEALFLEKGSPSEKECSKVSDDVMKLLHDGCLNKAISIFKKLANQTIFFEGSKLLCQTIFKKCLAVDPEKAIGFYDFFKGKSNIDISANNDFCELVEEHVCRLLLKDDGMAFELMDRFLGTSYKVDDTSHTNLLIDIFRQYLQRGSRNIIPFYERFGSILSLDEATDFKALILNAGRVCLGRGDIETYSQLVDRVAKPYAVKKLGDRFLNALSSGEFELAKEFEGRYISYSSSSISQIEGYEEAAKEGYCHNLIFGDLRRAMELKNTYCADVDLREEVSRACEYFSEGSDRKARQILRKLQEINSDCPELSEPHTEEYEIVFSAEGSLLGADTPCESEELKEEANNEAVVKSVTSNSRRESVSLKKAHERKSVCKQLRSQFLELLTSGEFALAKKVERKYMKYSPKPVSQIKGFDRAVKEGYCRNLVSGNFWRAWWFKRRYGADMSMYEEICRAYNYCVENGLQINAERILCKFRKEIRQAA